MIMSYSWCKRNHMNPLNIHRDIHNSLLISFCLDLIPVSLISLPYPYSFLTLSTILYDSVYIFYCCTFIVHCCPLLLFTCFSHKMWVLLHIGTAWLLQSLVILFLTMYRLCSYINNSFYYMYLACSVVCLCHLHTMAYLLWCDYY